MNNWSESLFLRAILALEWRCCLSSAALLLAVTCATHVAAQSGPALNTPAAASQTPAKEPSPLWEIGAFAVGGWLPAYPGSDQHFSHARLLPYALYRGSLLRVERGAVGLRAMRTPRLEWDVSASAAFGARASEVRARSGMPDIGTLVELGPALTLNLGDLVGPRHEARRTRLALPVRAVFDVNEGFASKGWTFEPELTHTLWRSVPSSLTVSAGVLFGDRGVNDMFYGVAPVDATPQRPAYAARAGLVSTRLGASLGRRLSPDLYMYWFAHVESVRGAVNGTSPLVRRQENAGVGVSLSWRIWKSGSVGVE